VDKIADPEVQYLAMCAAQLRGEYAHHASEWQGSPFKWILDFPSRTKGAIGEKLIAGWAAMKDFDVQHAQSTEHDRIINGRKIEIKFSTLWETGGFKFQQLRDQDYDYCFCLGLMPFDAKAWLIPKTSFREEIRNGHIVPQHTGATGTETFWIHVDANNPAGWLNAYGGRLSDVATLIAKWRAQ
jgi:hypothetical protein